MGRGKFRKLSEWEGAALVATSDLPEIPRGLSLGEFLNYCLEQGVRPKPKRGRPWTRTEFDKSLGEEHRRKFGYYFTDAHAPRDVTPIARALFGPAEEDWPLEWIKAIQYAADETRRRNAQKKADRPFPAAEASDTGASLNDPEEQEPASPQHRSTSPYERGRAAQLGVGGALIAVGLIHLVWLASRLAEEEVSDLIRQAWPFGDIVFGVAGIIVGVGTMRAQYWARSGGTWLCILGLISGVLWFVDDHPAVRVATAMNVISLPLAAAGLLYFLHWWPEP